MSLTFAALVVPMRYIAIPGVDAPRKLHVGRVVVDAVTLGSAAKPQTVGLQGVDPHGHLEIVQWMLLRGLDWCGAGVGMYHLEAARRRGVRQNLPVSRDDGVSSGMDDHVTGVSSRDPFVRAHVVCPSLWSDRSRTIGVYILRVHTGVNGRRPGSARSCYAVTSTNASDPTLDSKDVRLARERRPKTSRFRTSSTELPDDAD